MRTNMDVVICAERYYENMIIKKCIKDIFNIKGIKEKNVSVAFLYCKGGKS